MTSEQAQITIEQLGGTRALHLMTGAHTFVYGEDRGVSFKFKGSDKANYVQIRLKHDTYSMQFMKLRRYEAETVAQFEGVYVDMLQELFEETTGLTLSVPRIAFAG